MKTLVRNCGKRPRFRKAVQDSNLSWSIAVRIAMMYNLLSFFFREFEDLTW
jgi:hypothetical protein